MKGNECEYSKYIMVIPPNSFKMIPLFVEYVCYSSGSELLTVCIRGSKIDLNCLALKKRWLRVLEKSKAAKCYKKAQESDAWLVLEKCVNCSRPVPDVHRLKIVEYALGAIELLNLKEIRCYRKIGLKKVADLCQRSFVLCNSKEKITRRFLCEYSHSSDRLVNISWLLFAFNAILWLRCLYMEVLTKAI